MPLRHADGELEPLSAESTEHVAETRTHAGIVRVKRYAGMTSCFSSKRLKACASHGLTNWKASLA
jgi:hypothetical protein